MSTNPESPAKALAIEVDKTSSHEWSEICRGFRDTNIFQSWSYGAVRSGGADKVSHLVMKRGSNVLAACQVRIVKFPLLPSGLAFVRWGPLWNHHDTESNQDHFREAVRALRNEYVVRRKLILRIVPHLFEHEGDVFQKILAEEGFHLQREAKQDRTLLIDLSPTLDELHRGLHQKWRYNLNKSRKQNLELIQGTDVALFDDFRRIYDEMVDRKQLLSGSELAHFTAVQKDLPEKDKMRVFLCRFEGQVCAGSICSALGENGIYLLGATSNRGIKTFGSYLVHWTMLEWVKQQGCRWYDLNGINPVINPGGYQFKVQLGGATGRDVRFLGQFDAYPHAAAKLLVKGGELLRGKVRKIRQGRTKAPNRGQ